MDHHRHVNTNDYHSLAQVHPVDPEVLLLEYYGYNKRTTQVCQECNNWVKIEHYLLQFISNKHAIIMAFIAFVCSILQCQECNTKKCLISILLAKSIDLSKLSEKERWRIEHQRLHEKHRGHEAMHAEMVLILIVTLVVAQILLVQWRQRYFKSYQKATLVGMWVIPIGICMKYGWTRFIIIWSIFSVITGYITFRSTRKPLPGNTPRLVYKWFLLIYKVSYFIGILGYMVVMLTLLGLNLLFLIKPQIAMDFGLLCLFYGLYFGVVSRDFAEVCTDSMAAHIGYFTETGLPGKRLDPNVCGVCGNQILVMNNEDAIIEETFKLDCNHVFHEFCIRGWCIVGKRQTCPYCKEKVDLKRMFPSPWERPHVLYGNLLDWIRFLVAWQPLIIMLVQGINWSLGLE